MKPADVLTVDALIAHIFLTSVKLTANGFNDVICSIQLWEATCVACIDGGSSVLFSRPHFFQAALLLPSSFLKQGQDGVAVTKLVDDVADKAS